jgi:GT2 family glycosyltransferase
LTVGSDIKAYDILDSLIQKHDNIVVNLPFNHGSVRAINVGLQLAMLSPAPYILLLDNDTEIPSGDATWLTRWLKYFEDEKVGAAGAVSDYVSGVQYVEQVPDRFQRDFKTMDGDKVTAEGVKDPPSVPLLVSFAMMLRKSAVEQVGLWDERFEPGNYEDYDYSIRLRDAGYKLVIADSVWIHHKGSQTFGAMGFENLLQTNRTKFVDKWGVGKLAQMGLTVKSQ